MNEIEAGNKTPVGPATAELILAVSTVTGFTKACMEHGDSATYTELSRYYAAVSDAVNPAGGRIIKVMGDGVLITFPVDRGREAIHALQELQIDESARLRQFDERCHLQVKVTVGQVACGDLGPPGDERFDIVSDALNQLVKAPWSDFELTPEVRALVE